MSLNQQLTEFRFNLETLDLLTTMGKSSDYSIQMLSELGLNSQLIKFMQSSRMLLNSVLLRLQLYSEQNMSEQKIRSSLSVLNNQSVHALLDYLYKSTSQVKETPKKQSPPPTPKPEPEAEQQEEEENVKEEHIHQPTVIVKTKYKKPTNSVGVDDIQKLPLDWFQNVRQSYKTNKIIPRKREIVFQDETFRDQKKKI